MAKVDDYQMSFDLALEKLGSQDFITRPAWPGPNRTGTEKAQPCTTTAGRSASPLIRRRLRPQTTARKYPWLKKP